MDTLVMQPRTKTAVRTMPNFARRNGAVVKPPEYLFTRAEAKSLLGEYAFSMIDEARKSGADLDEVLDRLDAEGINTDDFEDAVLGRMMEESHTGEYVSEEQVMKSLRRLR